ncbi:DUF3168 domain-containing protein [Nioella ostreopsis]|uniref:DUF3168 domain-containing protein n=1 Tax=Nioella ostreopsis TaxID=2448479 RepID=UPI000FD78765|nr:DUF3168 domain-containing protein [Nioella ostreopsis]
MIEPSVALQTAIRAKLIADPAVTALVAPDHIRAGSTRPDRTPCVILVGGQTQYLGRASGSQLCARVFFDLHIWALEDGPDTAKAIGHAAALALINLDDAAGIEIDTFDMPRTIWLRDPQPELAYTHGIMDLEAVVRWRI